MEFQKGLPARQSVPFVLLLFALVGSCLLALTWDLRPFPISAGVDDSRYVLTAHYIQAFPGKLLDGVRPLDWLGPYDPTTLFKRPGISVLLAFFSFLRLPFIQTVLVGYLIGLAILSNGLLRLGYPRTVVAALFFTCGLLPTLYDSNAVRVLREIATGGLELAIFGVCLSFFTIGTNRPGPVLRNPRFFLLLGLLALHWSIREEGILLLPAVMILVAASLWLRDGTRHEKATFTAFALVLLLLPSQAAYLGIAALNRASYGLFLVNELSEGAFPRAVNVLKRVEESPCDHGLLSRDEVSAVMAVSPSFRVVGETLKLALTNKPQMIYTDAFSVMRVAALREQDLGWYPVQTQELFSAIATEVESACETGQLKCARRGPGGIVPLLCRPQWSMLFPTFLGYITEHIARARHSGFSPWSYEMANVDRLHPETLAMFEQITSQNMAGRSARSSDFSQPASLEVLSTQDHLRTRMGDLYSIVLPWIFGLGVMALLFGARHWNSPERPLWLIIPVAMSIHVLCRASIFSYLSTVDGYLNTRYISVCYPIALAVAVLSFAEWRYLLPSSWRPGRIDLPESKSSRGLVPMALALVVVFSFIYAGKRPGELPVRVDESQSVTGSLSLNGSGEFISMDGRQIPIVPESQGWLYKEAGWLRGDVALFDGWGMDSLLPGPAKSILLFADGNLIATATPSTPVPEVDRGFPEGQYAGFVIEVPYATVANRHVRLFALHNENRAGELYYPASYPYGADR